MKTNIDLTENNDFSNSSIHIDRLFRIGKRSYPWDFELLSIGTTRDIRLQRNYEKEYEFHCDRCGKDLNLKPWDKQYCLCNSCAEQLDYQMNCYSYQNKNKQPLYQELINTTDDRVMIELNWRETL